MYANAMKCDICNYVEFIDPTDALLMTDMTVPAGWVRVYANQPRRWSWDTEGIRSNMERAYDCCGTSCAMSALGEHNDNISHQKESQSA